MQNVPITIWKCLFCSNTFLLKSAFDEHNRLNCQEEQAQELFACGYCSETMALSNLKDHISQNHMQLCYCCGFCDLAFESLFYLNSHFSNDHEDVIVTKPITKVQMVLLDPSVKDECVNDQEVNSKLDLQELINLPSPSQENLIELDNIVIPPATNSNLDLMSPQELEIDGDEIREFMSPEIDQELIEVESFDSIQEYLETNQLDSCLTDEEEEKDTTEYERYPGDEFLTEEYQTEPLLLEWKDCQKGDQPFQCEFCSRMFSKKYNLLKHIKTIHYQEKKSFECNICHIKISSLPNLRKHIQNKHEKTFSCNICKKVFESKYFLDKHNFESHVQQTSYALNCKIMKSSV
ncbi:hypothetical protein ACFFRR_006452 [Megaselia abdita]